MNEIVTALGVPSRRRFLASSAALVAASTIPPPVSGAAVCLNAAPSVTHAKGDKTVHDFVTAEDGTHIYYKDWGSGRPIVFSHGWPLSADDWDPQMMFFLGHGYRVIAHDRRGHGRSTQAGDGHDMDHYADDLATLTAHLDLKNAIHVGHSTGGGEVVHYLARHGEKHV